MTTFAELDDAAGAIAAAVRAATKDGDRVLLIEPPGLEFVASFLGCLYAGRIPVPVYPMLDSADGRATIERIARDCQPALAWTWDAGVAEIASRQLGLSAEWRPAKDHRYLPQADPDAGTVAFLQYTSGSTSSPKGVMVTHGNLRANVTAIAEAFGHTQDEVILSWLPAYHDMGLIGNILHPLHLGCGAAICAPASFIRQPLSWLTAIDQLGVTTTGAPNFAYDLVAAAVERQGAPSVDLSRWRVAYSGAEPVIPETIVRFGELLGPRGFDPRAFLPCYGLAESTLLVACVEPGTGARSRPAPDGTAAVSCGPPRGCEVAITGSTGQELAPGTVGEIRVSGPSVAAGYWGRPNDEAFAGPVSGRAGSWLHTGDLGFIEGDELYVSGRIKDLIIVRGRNHHPHDIERLAARIIASFRPGYVIAFPAAAAGDGVVIIGERKPGTVMDPADVARFTRMVAESHGLAVRDVVGVPRRAIPRTTSGKLRRAAARQRYESGEYAAAAQAMGAEDIAAIVAEALGGRPADGETLTAAGLDSLRAVWLAGALSTRAGIEVPVQELLSGLTLRQLAEWPTGRAAVPAAQDPGRLSVAQQGLVFLDRLAPGTDQYTISAAWELDPGADAAAFEQALRSALAGQPQLARRVPDSAAALRLDLVPPPVLRDAMALAPVPVREDRLAEQLQDAAALPFRLAEGPLLRLYHWRTPARSVYQLVVHHVLTDLWSLGLLFRDVAARYAATLARVEAEEGTAASPAADPYAFYVAEQEEYLRSQAAAERDQYLRTLIPPGQGPLGIRADHPRGPQRDPEAASVRLELPREVGTGLERTDYVALLTGLWGACLHRYGPAGPVVVGVPVAGRPAGHHAMIAGLCTNTVPVAVAVDPAQPLDQLVRGIREQLLAGVGHGLYPLARAVEAVRPSRAAGRMPLVETLVTVQESPLREIPGLMAALAGEEWVELGPLRLRPVTVPRRTCRYDLDLVVTPCGAGRYLLTLDYAARLFEPATAEGILRTYAAMVAAACAGAVTVGDAFVLPNEQRELYRTAGRSVIEAATPSVAGLVRVAASEAPAAPAVVANGSVMSFGDLLNRIEHLSGALTTLAGQAGKGTGDDRV